MLQIFRMKFASKGYLLILLIGLVVAQSCNSSSEDETEIETNDYGEQSLTDDAAILEFLESHTYNYEDFETPIARLCWNGTWNSHFK